MRALEGERGEEGNEKKANGPPKRDVPASASGESWCSWQMARPRDKAERFCVVLPCLQVPLRNERGEADRAAVLQPGNSQTTRGNLG